MNILNKKIKNDIAMTGEIETNGCITAIGGLECKLLGAKKAGVKLVLYPEENQKVNVIGPKLLAIASQKMKLYFILFIYL